MRRRHLIAGLAGAVAGGPLLARAQGQPVPTIGFLGLGRPAPNREFEAFVSGLADYGYTPGRNITLETRFAGNDEPQLPRLAAELVALKVAVIVAFTPAFTAAMGATKTIPIIIRTTADPVKSGYVASLSHPGGNVTGISSVSGELYRKRVELLTELRPGLKRLALLSTAGAGPNTYRDEITSAATQLGLEVTILRVHTAADIAPAVAAAAAQADALIPARSPLIVANARAIARAAAANRLPAIYDDRVFVEMEGLASYGANLAVLHRRAAYFVDRILRGAKPAELPMEEPTTFELVISLKAAKAIGLSVPQPLLARADEVIE